MLIFLETDRITLRRFTQDDVDNLYGLDSDPEVMRFLSGGKPTPYEEVRDEIIPFLIECYQRYDGLGYWAAQARPDGDFLGWFQLRPVEEAGAELGYRLRRTAWNKGYATEGSRALISKAFTDYDVDRVFAHTMTTNSASRRVMEKCGLVFVRTFHPDRLPDIPGAELAAVEYALTRAAWQASTTERAATASAGAHEIGSACLSSPPASSCSREPRPPGMQ